MIRSLGEGVPAIGPQILRRVQQPRLGHGDAGLFPNLVAAKLVHADLHRGVVEAEGVREARLDSPARGVLVGRRRDDGLEGDHGAVLGDRPGVQVADGGDFGDVCGEVVADGGGVEALRARLEEDVLGHCQRRVDDDRRDQVRDDV